MNKNKTYQVKINEEGSALKIIKTEVDFMSKNNLKTAFERGQITLKKKVIKANHPVKPGDIIEIDLSKKVHFTTNALEQLDVIFENHEMLVVNKPSGLLSVANNKEKHQTMYHAATDYVKQQNVNNRIFIVHRLDQDTSGVMLFVKNVELKYALQDNWNNLVKTREYVAVVEGKVDPKSDVIKSYLKTTKTNLTYSSKDKTAQEAITEYEVIKQIKEYALVKINLKTGRKNQIRVHFNDKNNPVTGDKMYYAKNNPIKRLALHATVLEFTHPFNKKTYTFKSDIPNNFLKLFK